LLKITTVDSSVIGGISQQEKSISTQNLEDIAPAKQELLWKLVEKSTANLNNHQQQKLFTLLLSFVDVFAICNDDLGRTNKLTRTIPTGTNQPIRQAARRVPPFKKEEVHQLLQDMLSRGVIRPSTSPWASPVVLVQKKDGSTRFCLDYTGN